MYNFVFHVPTEVHFGKGTLKDLPEIANRYGKKAMLVYGGQGIKTAPFWGEILDLLKGAGVQYTEFSMEPNPKVDAINEGVALARKNGVEMLIAVGGGSAIDTSKLIAACFHYDGDAWDIVSGKAKITAALPIIAVSTVAATGSDMDDDGVIGNPVTKEKISCPHPLMRPSVSILDPTLTFSVPKRQTSLGTLDIMSHVFEQYFTHIRTAYIQDRFCESILKTCIHYGPVALAEPDNYEARANLQWCASLALCGLIGCGKAEPWSVHVIESMFCARYNTTHGAVLSILTPVWMEMALNGDTADKFAEYGVNVWGLDPDRPAMDNARAAIRMTREFFTKMGGPATFAEIGIDDGQFRQIAAVCGEIPDLTEGFLPLDADGVLKLLTACK